MVVLRWHGGKKCHLKACRRDNNISLSENIREKYDANNSIRILVYYNKHRNEKNRNKTLVSVCYIKKVFECDMRNVRGSSTSYVTQ